MFGSSNRIIIQIQTSKTAQKLVTEHKTKLLLWPFQSSDLNPVENEWGELKRRSIIMQLAIWRIWRYSGWRNGLWSLVMYSLTSSGIIWENVELLNWLMKFSKSKYKIKRFNNADKFSQPSLIIFTKGANFFDHDCICEKDVCKFVVKLIYLVCFKLFKWSLVVLSSGLLRIPDSQHPMFI